MKKIEAQQGKRRTAEEEVAVAVKDADERDAVEEREVDESEAPLR